MNNKNESKNIIIFVVILLIFTGLYVVINKFINKESIEYDEFLKNYEVNEYIPSYVSDEEMTRIYLKHYIHTMYSNIDRAYNLLDEEYRIKKFGNITNYENYVRTLLNTTHELDKFYVDSVDGYKIYGAYDTNGNLFIFKTKGVMQYTVYLDDYTVEI